MGFSRHKVGFHSQVKLPLRMNEVKLLLNTRTEDCYTWVLELLPALTAFSQLKNASRKSLYRVWPNLNLNQSKSRVCRICT